MRSPGPARSPGFRARTADALVRLGSRILHALADLARVVDPRLDLPTAGPARPLLGLIIVWLLVAGLALTAGGAVWAIREAVPHREVTP